MSVRFQADADLNQIILLATLRQEPAVDFRSAADAGLAGLSDQEVLALAAGEERILVTHDRRTMPRHFSDFVVDRTSAGVLVVPQSLAVATVVDDLLLIWHASEPGEWINQIRSLPL
jgi:hypothetical protein